tara:strand:- start:249 stop:845 length:597 start_codon:yes stop_codon:yes gene_type:complete
MNEEQLNKYFNVRKFDKPYQPFYEPTGFNDNEIRINTSYWWTEDLVVDKLEKIKLFRDSRIFKTRELYAKPEQEYEDYIFKGPLSPIDLWVPGEAFIEIRYTSACDRDYWHYDFQLKNISNVTNWVRDPGAPSRNQYKIYLVVFHSRNISVIDLSEKLNDWCDYDKIVKIPVKEEHCFKRLQVTNEECKEYRAQCNDG